MHCILYMPSFIVVQIAREQDAAAMQQTDMVADVLQLTQVVRGDDGRQTSVRYILGKQALYCLANDRVETIERLIAE